MGRCRADPDLETFEVRTPKQARDVRNDSWRQKAKSCASNRGVDDDDDGPALDRRNSQAFGLGHAKVAFERFFAASELIRPSYQYPEGGRIIGDNGLNRLPRTGAFGARHGNLPETDLAQAKGK